MSGSDIEKDGGSPGWKEKWKRARPGDNSALELKPIEGNVETERKEEVGSSESDFESESGSSSDTGSETVGRGRKAADFKCMAQKLGKSFSNEDRQAKIIKGKELMQKKKLTTCNTYSDSVMRYPSLVEAEENKRDEVIRMYEKQDILLQDLEEKLQEMAKISDEEELPEVISNLKYIEEEKCKLHKRMEEMKDEKREFLHNKRIREVQMREWREKQSKKITARNEIGTQTDDRWESDDEMEGYRVAQVSTEPARVHSNYNTPNTDLVLGGGETGDGDERFTHNAREDRRMGEVIIGHVTEAVDRYSHEFRKYPKFAKFNSELSRDDCHGLDSLSLDSGFDDANSVVCQDDDDNESMSERSYDMVMIATLTTLMMFQG
ncbi:uncharacterized protein [Amphiura filiformis]|uniref:uncharacterized protein n=1 Tax=Amphiura filiformis TaxID=82378 RepID=UPI003B21DE93